MRKPFSLAVAAVLALAALGAAAQAASTYGLDIVNPVNDATIFNDHGDVLVRVAVVPDLAPGDRVELLVDGESAARPAVSLEFQLSGITPGLHLVQARIIDATGNVGSVSPSTVFYVFQASVLHPIAANDVHRPRVTGSSDFPGRPARRPESGK